MKWEKLSRYERHVFIAEKIMGWVWRNETQYLPRRLLPSDYDPINGTVHIPDYTTDIAAAWQVVERATDIEIMSDDGGKWRVVYCLDEVGAATEATAPEAICRAALRAKGVDI